MVANVRTKVGALSAPEYDTVGPLMDKLNIHKLKVIPDTLTKTEVKVLGRERATVTDYRVGAEQHSATICDHAGRIICEYCTSGSKYVAWCHHIQYIVSKGVDLSLYSMGSDTSRMIAVPIIPTEGIFAALSISKRDDHADFLNVCMTLNIDADEIDVNLGVVRIGQFGTQQLRSIAVDFLSGHMGNEEYFTGKFVPYDSAQEKVSLFAHRFYLAVAGVSLAEWRAGRGLSADAPVF